MYHLFRWTRASRGRNFLTRHYEPLQPYFLMALAERAGCDTFLDIGANIGGYALLMTKVPGVRQVHAFEPGPDSFEQLRENVRLNELEGKVSLHNKAVSDRPGELRFGIVHPLSGANSVIDTSIHVSDKFARDIRVEAVMLDDYLPLSGQRLCVKMGIEGHERAALAGMAGVLADNDIVLQIEDRQGTDTDIAGALQGYGLRPMTVIGPDRYFTNIEALLSDREIVHVFEHASVALVEASLALLQECYGADGVSPVDIGLGRLAGVQLKGPAATLARRVRAALRA